MKKDVHPNYGPIVIEDISAGFRVLTRSTLAVETKETTKWDDGNEYPVLKVEISSASHPFYTGKQMLVDTANRVGKFEERMAKQAELAKSAGKGKKVKKAEAQAEKEAEAATEEPKAASADEQAEVAAKTAKAAEKKAEKEESSEK